MMVACCGMIAVVIGWHTDHGVLGFTDPCLGLHRASVLPAHPSHTRSAVLISTHQLWVEING